MPPYVLDFACVEALLAVEVDSGQHGGAADARRDAALSTAGWLVLRYWNNAVLQNVEGVVADICRHVRERLG